MYPHFACDMTHFLLPAPDTLSLTTASLQAYHSQFNSEDNRLIANLALLPLRTNYKGPAPKTCELLFQLMITVIHVCSHSM